jgi:hypothetical protein
MKLYRTTIATLSAVFCVAAIGCASSTDVADSDGNDVVIDEASLALQSPTEADVPEQVGPDEGFEVPGEFAERVPGETAAQAAVTFRCVVRNSVLGLSSGGRVWTKTRIGCNKRTHKLTPLAYLSRDNRIVVEDSTKECFGTFACERRLSWPNSAGNQKWCAIGSGVWTNTEGADKVFGGAQSCESASY